MIMSEVHHAAIDRQRTGPRHQTTTARTSSGNKIMGRSSPCLLAVLLLQGALLLRSASAVSQQPSSSSSVGANFFVSVSVDLSSSDADDDDDDDNLHLYLRSPSLNVIDEKRLSRSASQSPRHTSSSASSPSVPSPNTNLESLLNSRYASAYDGGCLISAQALMCQGGGVDQEQGHSDNDGEEDRDDNDDDDDDDNDDGHSSMLSNASLKRSRDRINLLVSSGGGGGSSRFQGGGSGDDVRAHGDSTDVRSAFFRRSSCASTAATTTSTKSSLLSLRGGASAGTGGAVGILQSQAARNLLVTALVTLVFEGSIGHILEFLKIVKQTAAVDVSYLQVLRDITHSKGLAGLWDGFCPWGIVQAVFKGAVFGLAYQVALNAMKPLVEAKLLPAAAALTLAGGIGGGLQGYVLSPTLLLKTRVMTNPVFREPMSVLRTTWLSFQIGYDICATEGFLTLMKGSNVFALKRVFDWSSRYLFSDLFESLFLAVKGGGGSATLTVAEKSLASLLGGVFSTCVTLPLDVLVAKTQDAKKAGVKVSAIKLFLDELHERGWSGLQKAYMQGFEARLLHVCLTTLVIKTLTPIAYKLLFP